MINEMEPDVIPLQKPQQRGPTLIGEDTRMRGIVSHKESRHGSGSGSSREQFQQDDSSLLAHPGDLVICKKKRKDREKSMIKTRIGSAGPVSPPGMGRGMKSPGPGSTAKETRLTQQPTNSQGWSNQAAAQPGNGAGGSVGWANPVKRLRTDSGKRRPSHL